MHAVIVSNGFPPTKALLEKELLTADLLIGADGGGNRILEHGVTPHVVIGDMDSFEKPEQADFEIIHQPEQETNDLEKALSLALQRGSATVHVLGAFGKRMDHSLKNLSVMKKFDGLFDVLIYRDETFDAFIIDDHFSGELPVGSTVSLFPLSGETKGIKTQGLKYPLKSESLKNGARDGSSNETIQPEFTIEIEEGDLVVFLERGKK